MLLAEDEETEEEDAIQASSSTPYSGPRKINSGLQLQIVEFLEREVTEVHDRWETLSAQNQGISAAMVQNFVGFIITSSIFVANCTGQSLAKSRALDAKIQETLVPRLMSFLASEDCSQMMIDSMYIAVNGLLPKASSIISSTGTINSLENFRGTTGIVISRISTILSEREKVKEKSHNQPDSIDAMDIDNKVFEFPDNEHKVEKKGSELIREELEAFCSVETFRASTQALIRLCAIALTDEASEDVCGEFVSFLLDTPRARLVMMRPVIEDFLSAARDIFRDSDAFSICEHLPIQLLQGYYIETCEASIALCIDVITALAEKWTSSNQNKNFVETCESVFDHVIKIGLDKMTTSYSIRILISRLLERILTVNSGYRKDHEQAPLTLFIDILQDSDIRVLFLHTQRLHVLFKIYGESSHLNICENIEPKLPSDQEWQEGLAIRVNALGLIALASPPNISRTLYRIYETGQLEKGSKYSARALLTVAKASGLEDARALFKIFSQKLVHAWIPYNDLEDFPASVFGYKNLKEMYNDAPGEMVAQLLVKGNDEGASSVAEILGIGLKELVIREFSKVMAYALTWAIGTPPSHDKGAGEQKPNLVVRIKKLIGDETYKRLFEENFPSIISEIYLLMQMYEDGISETFLPRDAAMGEAYATMQEIIHEGYSERALPLPILPHYKNKYIMGAIQSACTIFSLDEKTELWKPGMVTFIARKLFDTLHPAQGPAHSCGVIRNIRFLICLSGPMVHEGYTLQMLIQGLKPYITDITCAEDTIGVLRYLLRKGNEYLSKHPSFVIGIFLSILAYIRKFSTETMNTAAQQDNQVRSTMGVIQKFHSWLAEHLSKMNFPSLTARQNEAFQAIVESAVGFRHHVNAVKGTKESQLLRHLLDDDMTDDKLLDEVSQRLAFSLFCSSFSRPETFRDDIFGDDQESFVRAKSLLHICRSSGVNDGFLLWSARVLGRAYASTGQLHNEWMLEMELTHSEEFSGSRSLPDMTPKVEILRKLKALLFSDDRSVVTLAEGTLARIIRDEKYLEEVTFTYVLDSDEYSALISSGPPDEKASTPQPLSNFSDLKSPVNVWIRDLTIAICTNITEIPIINNLKEILYKVSGLAEELFPFITHILLARDISQRIILEKEDARISMRIKDIADQKPREVMRKALTELFEQCFRKCVPNTVPHNTILLKTILYLRTQKMEGEMSHADRDRWLPLKFIDAARAASKCKMFKTALLFAEQHSYGYEQPVPVSRSQSRKSITPPVGFERTQEDVPSELLLEIFKNIDDPDSFYGVSQNFNLETVMKNFEYEGDGWNSLSLRGANLESDIRFGASSENESLGIIDALNTLGMNGLSHSFLQSGTITSLSSGRTVDNTYRSAWKLEQWDLPCPTTCDTRSAPIYRALQSVNNTIDSRPVSLHVDPHYLGVMKQITAGTQTGHTLRGGMRTLAMLAEMEEVFVSKDAGQLDEAWIRTQARNSWMETGKYVFPSHLM